jgi:plasmid stabilization system protein ParE
VKVVWEPSALADLAEAAERYQRWAAAVVRRVEVMAEVGWSLGRPSGLDPTARYLPVGRLGVFYRVRGGELRVLRVVDARRPRELP